jgi:hypothetical protein
MPGHVLHVQLYGGVHCPDEQPRQADPLALAALPLDVGVPQRVRTPVAATCPNGPLKRAVEKGRKGKTPGVRGC